MRKLSSAVNTMLSLYNTKSFFLVELSGLSRYHTTLPFNITMSNGITYTSDGGLVGVDPPRLSSVVDREAYKISFADFSYDFRTAFNQGIVGDPLTVRIGFFNTSDSAVAGFTGTLVQPGQVFTNINDTIIVYEGVIDNHSYDIDVPGSSSTCLIEGSSPMAHLDLVKSFFTSRDQMRQVNTSDSSLDEVYKGSGEISLRWGKI